MNLIVADQTNDLELPRRDPSGVDGIMTFPKAYQSEHMAMLEKVYNDDSAALLNQLAFDRDVKDSEEAILVMYVAAVIMNQQAVYKHILKKNKEFKFKPT